MNSPPKKWYISPELMKKKSIMNNWFNMNEKPLKHINIDFFFVMLCVYASTYYLWFFNFLISVGWYFVDTWKDTKLID